MLICASLAAGDSIISNIDFSDDILATLKGIKALGAKVSYVKANSNLETYDVIIKGKGYPEIVQQTVDCFESGSTLRFLIPIALLDGKQITFTGRGRISQRHIDEY